MMDTDVDIEGMAKAVCQLANTLEDLLQYGRQAAQESISEFVNSKIGKLFGMAAAYEKCFESIGASTKDEMEEKIHKYARNVKLREASTELLDVEQEWDSFLKEVDKSLEGDVGDTVQLNETGPINYLVQDARTSQQTSLKDLLVEGQSFVLILLRHFA